MKARTAKARSTTRPADTAAAYPGGGPSGRGRPRQVGQSRLRRGNRMDRTSENRAGREPEDNRLAVQSAVARALSEATTATDAAQRVLGSIGTTLGWRLGAVWEVDPAGDCIRCVESWRGPRAGAPGVRGGGPRG